MDKMNERKRVSYTVCVGGRGR